MTQFATLMRKRGDTVVALEDVTVDEDVAFDRIPCIGEGVSIIEEDAVNRYAVVDVQHIPAMRKTLVFLDPDADTEEL